MSRSFSQRALAPCPSSEEERAPRFPPQAANHESCFPQSAPIRPDKPWKWPVRFALQPCAHAKNILQIAAAAKYLESIRQPPKLSSCSRCESFDTPAAARPALISASLRRRTPAAGARNRQREMRSRCCPREFPDSDLQFRRSRKQPWQAAEIPSKRFHVHAARYKCTRRRCGFYPETLRFAEAREYSKC